MDPIRTLIVDDEPLARRNLLLRLREIPDFEVVGECATGREAVAAVRERRPDLLFLDIRMPDMDGFGVLERIDPEILPVVVFVTAYDRFALEAFRVHALDYLLKPFEERPLRRRPSKRAASGCPSCADLTARRRRHALRRRSLPGPASPGPDAVGRIRTWTGS